jgi:non-heme chloroperoxidase
LPAPALILDGDDDQIVPISASALLSSMLIKKAALNIYRGDQQGRYSAIKDQINEALLAFFKAEGCLASYR